MHRFTPLILCFTIIVILCATLTAQLFAQSHPHLLGTFVEEQNEYPFYDRIATTPKGDLVAAGQGFGMGIEPHITVWSVATGKVMQRFSLSQRTGRSERTLVSTFAFSPDSQNLAMVDHFTTVSIRALDSGQSLHFLRPGIGEIHGLKYSNDGQLLACLGNTSLAIYRLSDTAKPVVIKAESKQVLDADFSSDNRLLVSAGRDRTVKLWRVADGRRVNQHAQHKAAVHACAFVEGTTGIASVDQEGAQFFWDTQTGKAMPAPENGPRLSSAVFAPDGRFYVRGSLTQLEVRSAQSGRLLSQAVNEETISTLAASATHKFVAVLGVNRVQAWSMEEE